MAMQLAFSAWPRAGRRSANEGSRQFINRVLDALGPLLQGSSFGFPAGHCGNWTGILGSLLEVVGHTSTFTRGLAIVYAPFHRRSDPRPRVWPQSHSCSSLRDTSGRSNAGSPRLYSRGSKYPLPCPVGRSTDTGRDLTGAGQSTHAVPGSALRTRVLTEGGEVTHEWGQGDPAKQGQRAGWLVCVWDSDRLAERCLLHLCKRPLLNWG